MYTVWPTGKLVAVRDLIDRNLLHHGLVAFAVRLGGGDVHVLRVALRHVLHGGVEPRGIIWPAMQVNSMGSPRSTEESNFEPSSRVPV